MRTFSLIVFTLALFVFGCSNSKKAPTETEKPETVISEEVQEVADSVAVEVEEVAEEIADSIKKVDE